MKERKTVLISINSDTTTVPPAAGPISSFSANIFIPFQPDEVIVRQVTIYVPGVVAAGGYQTIIVTSDLIDNLPLFSVLFGDSVIQLNNKFPITRFISGSYNFNFLNINNSPNVLQCQLSFILEFVKY